MAIWASDSGGVCSIPGTSFPGFKWEDEPAEVEITIKRKG